MQGSHKMTKACLSLTLLLSFSACGKQDASIPFSSSEEKLISTIQSELKVEPVIKLFDNTLWVYVPLEKGFLGISASKDGPKKSKQITKKQTIKYLETSFANKTFHVEYDIAPQDTYQKSLGYGSSYSEDFQAKRQGILTAIFRSYADAKKPPSFIVIIVADIVNGLDMRTTVAFADIKRAFTDQSFHEEYAKRTISDYPFGLKAIINDKEGKYVDFFDMTWGEFLAKQMEYRINFKYTRSAFSPSDDADLEVTQQLAIVLNSYAFDDYEMIELRNIKRRQEYKHYS